MKKRMERVDKERKLKIAMKKSIDGKKTEVLKGEKLTKEGKKGRKRRSGGGGRRTGL